MTEYLVQVEMGDGLSDSGISNEAADSSSPTFDSDETEEAQDVSLTHGRTVISGEEARERAFIGGEDFRAERFAAARSRINSCGEFKELAQYISPFSYTDWDKAGWFSKSMLIIKVPLLFPLRSQAPMIFSMKATVLLTELG